MDRVCSLLNVELEEEFKIYGDSDTYRISIRGIERFIERDWHTAPASVLEDLLMGISVIRPNRYKPKTGDTYCYIGENDGLYSTFEDKWTNSLLDLERYKLGNCYKSYKEAELNKNKYVKELKRFYDKEFTY